MKSLFFPSTLLDYIFFLFGHITTNRLNWSRPSVRKLIQKSAQNPRFLLIITGWGESGKVILQVSIAFFSGAVEKIFGQGWLSPPRKIGPYAYADNLLSLC